MIRIQRLISTPHYTEGKLFVNGFEVCDTLELPWRNNKTDVSCIPAAAAAYRVVKRKAGRFAAAAKGRWGHDGSLEIKPVSGRDVILIHWGNTTADILGCVLVGEKLRDGVVWRSRDVYAELWEQLEPWWKDHEGVGLPLEVAPAAFAELDAEFPMMERMEINPEDL